MAQLSNYQLKRGVLQIIFRDCIVDTVWKIKKVVEHPL